MLTAWRYMILNKIALPLELLVAILSMAYQVHSSADGLQGSVSGVAFLLYVSSLMH